MSATPAGVRLRFRARASRLVDALGLRRPVFRLREWLISRRDRRAGADGEGTPIPSPYLRTLVVGTPDLDWFLNSGRADAQEFDAVLRRHGGALFGGGAVLEWGCGCGRLARWVAPRAGGFTGVDINPRLVRWCAANLPGSYRRNAPSPPTSLEAASADVIYACSVLTHLREASAAAWLAELARLLRPGGLALLTFHDPAHPGAAAVAQTLGRHGWAVRFDALEGSNNLAAYVTPEHLAAMASPRLDLREYVSSTASGSLQALAVFARPATAEQAVV